MTKFADELFRDLIREHGPALQRVQPPAAPRRRVTAHPAWLGAGAAGLAAATAASVAILGGDPAYAAYTVTPHANGTVTVSVSRPAGVAGANAALHKIGARVVVVPVHAGCPSLSSLPHPTPAPHLSIAVAAGKRDDGHRSVTVRIGKPGIPPNDTMLLAFSTGWHGGGVGAGGLITGKPPRCLSLPPPPTGRGLVTGSG